MELEMDSPPSQKKPKKVTKNKEGFAKVEDNQENSSREKSLRIKKKRSKTQNQDYFKFGIKTTKAKNAEEEVVQ